MTLSAIILLSHGSRRKEANEELLKMAELLNDSRNRPDIIAVGAFLQFGRPSLEEALENMILRGCSEIVVAPFFLSSGVHITEDIPKIMAQVKEKYPRINFFLCPPIGCDPQLIPIIWKRIGEKAPF